MVLTVKLQASNMLCFVAVLKFSVVKTDLPTPSVSSSIHLDLKIVFSVNFHAETVTVLLIHFQWAAHGSNC